MFNRIGRALIIGCILGGLCGCYSYVPVVVEVRDAETGRPVPDAHVETAYRTFIGDVSPDKSHAITNAQGQATLTVTHPGRASLVEATAAGYMEGWGAFSPEEFLTWRARDRTRPPTAGATSRPSADLTIHLYSKPEFSVVMVVPNGYRGVIRVRTRYRQAPFPIGQREFATTIDPKIVNDIAIPLPLWRSPFVAWRARYADGIEVPNQGEPETVRLRWVDSVSAPRGGTAYVIGTKQEREAAWSKYFPMRTDEEFERD